MRIVIEGVISAVYSFIFIASQIAVTKYRTHPCEICVYFPVCQRKIILRRLGGHIMKSNVSQTSCGLGYHIVKTPKWEHPHPLPFCETPKREHLHIVKPQNEDTPDSSHTYTKLSSQGWAQSPEKNMFWLQITLWWRFS